MSAGLAAETKKLYSVATKTAEDVEALTERCSEQESRSYEQGTRIETVSSNLNAEAERLDARAP